MLGYKILNIFRGLNLKSSSLKKIIWSPDLKESNGQNIVTNLIYENLDFSRSFFYKSGSDFISMLKAIKKSLSLVRTTWIKSDFDILLYCIVSRSFFGYLRDLPVYLFAHSNFFVIHLHGAEVRSKILRSILGYTFRFLALRSRCLVIVPSNQIANLIRESSKGEFEVITIENPSLFLPKKSFNTKENQHAPLFFWNSNLIEEKGYLDFLQTLFEIEDFKTSSLEVMVVGKLIGSKTYQEKVQKIHTELLKNSFAFEYLGPVNRFIMEDLLKKCTHVILPSRYNTECQPLSIIEAMCYGKQIIISDLPALLETIGSYPHYSFKLSDPKGLTYIIEKALKDFSHNKVYELAPQLDDIKYARNRFCKEEFLVSINEVFNE